MKFNTRFNLRRTSSKKPEIIYLICRFNGEKFVYPTPFAILPKHWDIKAGCVKNVIKEINRDDVNAYLKDLQRQAVAIFEQTTFAREIFTRDLLKRKLDKWAGLSNEKQIEFWGWVNSYLEDAKTKINPKTGKPISPKTLMQYNISIKHFKDFEISQRKKIDFATLDIELLADYREYLTYKKGYALNNIAKQIDNLRVIFRAGISIKLPIKSEVLDTRLFATPKETPQDVYLTDQEIESIANLDFTDTKDGVYIEVMEKGEQKKIRVNFGTLDRVRDLFLIGCYSGLRVSDYNDIQPHNIKDNIIDIYQHKTGRRVAIPISRELQSILNKYNGLTPPKISDQKLNMYLKPICKLAGIVEDVEKRQTKGGQTKIDIQPKFELVTSHTARRSFATNMIRKGTPINFIMAITGHKKEDVFLKYVKLSPIEYAEISKAYFSK